MRNPLDRLNLYPATAPKFSHAKMVYAEFQRSKLDWISTLNRDCPYCWLIPDRTMPGKLTLGFTHRAFKYPDGCNPRTRQQSLLAYVIRLYICQEISPVIFSQPPPSVISFKDGDERRVSSTNALYAIFYQFFTQDATSRLI